MLDPVWSSAPADALAPAEEAINLFALVDGAAAAEMTENDLPVPPVLYRVGPIVALISKVPLVDYCGADANRRLSDLAWLAPRTLQHATVLHHAMQWSAVYPAPFATLFGGIDTLTSFMLAHMETLNRFFRTVAGAAEWELKASACLGTPSELETIARATWPEWTGLSPGTRYLRLARDRTGLIAARRALLQNIADRFARRLQPSAAALRPLALQPAPDGGSEEPVGRFALLLPLTRERAFDRRVAELTAEAADEGIALTLSGPWPPFSFRPDLPGPIPLIPDTINC